MSALNTIAVTSVLLGLQVAIAVADGPPKLDLAPTCDAAARFSIMAGRDKEACLEDEHTAESTLAQNRSKYNAGRQDAVYREREDWRAGKLCGTAVLLGDHAGRQGSRRKPVQSTPRRRR
jgi:hypothetical protein